MTVKTHGFKRDVCSNINTELEGFCATCQSREGVQHYQITSLSITANCPCWQQHTMSDVCNLGAPGKTNPNKKLACLPP